MGPGRTEREGLSLSRPAERKGVRPPAQVLSETLSASLAPQRRLCFSESLPSPTPVSLSLPGTPPPGPSIIPGAPQWGLCRVWSPTDPLAPHLPPAAPGAHWGPTTRRRGRVHRSICTGPRERCQLGPEGSRPESGPPGASGQGAEGGPVPPPWTERIWCSQRQSDTGGSGSVQR